VVETEFFLQALMRLLADPARLDGGFAGAQRGADGKVGEIELPLAAGASLADEPDLLARYVLVGAASPCATTAAPIPSSAPTPSPSDSIRGS